MYNCKRGFTLLSLFDSNLVIINIKNQEVISSKSISILWGPGCYVCDVCDVCDVSDKLQFTIY